jgi:hypothetical protein
LLWAIINIFFIGSGSGFALQSFAAITHKVFEAKVFSLQSGSPSAIFNNELINATFLKLLVSLL